MQNQTAKLMITGEKMLNVAVEAALSAGSYLREHFGETGLNQEVKESHYSIVTEHDITSQNIICEHISKNFPDSSIISEESDNSSVKTEGQIWIIDPIDGSSYFARGIDSFCIAIGCLEDQSMKIGVVYSPIQGELFYSVRGKGSYLNNNRIKVSNYSNLSESIFSGGHKLIREDIYNTGVKKLVQNSRSIRAGGSCAQELCNVACGRIDGMITVSQKVWDYSAAMLILQEAGGRVTDLKGNMVNVIDNLDKRPHIVGTNSLLHDRYLEFFN